MSDILYPKTLIDSMLSGFVTAGSLAPIATTGVLGSATGTLTLAQMPPGTVFFVSKSGANWLFAGSTVTTRPTSRTDMMMISVSGDGTTPTFAITGDIGLT